MSVRKLWRLWALVLVAVVLAALTLLRMPQSEEAPTAAAAAQEARLPTLAPLPAPLDPTPALAKLSQSTLWGPLAPRPASNAASGAAPAPAQWALTGFYELTGTRFVIVSFEQQALPPQLLKLGDKLPDGSRIEQIEPDRARARRPRARVGAGTPSSRWLPITPGLSTPLPYDKR